MTQQEVPITRWPVVEAFKSIQGEGIHTGRAVVFVRFAGCDIHCPWCDTQYAWDTNVYPALGLTDLMASIHDACAGELVDLPVVLTGGNPTMYDLSPLVELLAEHAHPRWVEIPGNHFPEWLDSCEHICLSPKLGIDLDEVLAFATRRVMRQQSVEIKVVIFEPDNLDRVLWCLEYFPSIPTTIQLGRWPSMNLADNTLRWQELVEAYLDRPELHRPNVQLRPQLHYLLWGNQRGR